MTKLDTCWTDLSSTTTRLDELNVTIKDNAAVIAAQQAKIGLLQQQNKDQQNIIDALIAKPNTSC